MMIANFRQLTSFHYQPTPLAHGAAFSEAPMMAEEWIVEVAFRVHGPSASGMTEKLEDGTTKKVHKGGRGLAFWYTKVREIC